MVIRRLACLIVVLILVGCEPGIIDAPTPTQETHYETPVPVWDVSCLPSGVFPLNQNPCLSPSQDDTRPYRVEWVIHPNERHNGLKTVVAYIDGSYVLVLAGEFGEGFAGFVGLRIDNLALDAGQCYALNLEGRLDLRDMPSAEWEDMSAQAFVYTDNGDRIPLGKHSVTVGEWPFSEVNEFPDWFWVMKPGEDMTIVIETGIDQVHANARMGNNFRIDAVYFHPVDNALCDDAPAL